MYERIQERKKGKGKINYLRKPRVDASLDNQGVNIKVIM
jgi:hypothetical protein